MRALFFSDLHLKKADTWLPNGLLLQHKAIDQALSYAQTNSIETVIIGGDISEDHYLDGAALTVLLDLLCKYDTKLDIHIILGNHDIASTDAHSMLPVKKLIQKRRFRTVHLYDKPEHRYIDNTLVNFLPYPHGADSRYRTKKAAVNVAHLEWRGSVRDNGKSRIDDGYYHKSDDTWLIGHLHTPQSVGKHVHYCGTLYQCNFGENLDKSMILFEGDAIGYSIKRIPVVLPYRLLNITITELSQLDKLPHDLTDLIKLRVLRGIPVPNNLPPNVIKVLGVSEKEEEAPASNSGLELMGQSFDLALKQHLVCPYVCRIARQVGLLQNTPSDHLTGQSAT